MHDTDSNANISDAAIRAALSRVSKSSMFAMSGRLRRFLEFTIESALNGTADEIKESIIGEKVYDRKPPHDPSQDSIVRSEARRLRGKLKEYYQTEGRGDPVVISFRPGRYIPLFRNQAASEAVTASDDRSEPIYSEGAGVTLAVIPFADETNGPLFAPCARDITDELTHELMQTDGCKVAAPSAVAQLIAEGVNVRSLAQRLGVQVIFEGTVREENNRLRVTARVMNAEGFQLSSQRFDAQPDPQELFAIAGLIASALVSRTRPELVGIRKLKASVSRSVLDVYPALLVAEALLDKGTAADTESALVRFQEVAETAPNYARPLCGIAQCHYETALSGVAGSSVIIAKGKEAAARAIELEPEMIASHTCMACLQALEMDWPGAELSFRKALALGTHAGTHRGFALFLCAAGRFDEAWHYLYQAQQIDPFSLRQKVACAKFFHLGKRSEEAFEHFSEREVFGPLPIKARLYLALIHIQCGRNESAKKLAQAAQREAAAEPALMARVAEVLALCGDHAAAVRIVDDFHLLRANSPLSRFRQALIAISLGDIERALSDLSGACEQKEAERVWLAVEPGLDPLRENQQFARLVEAVMRDTSNAG